MRTVLSTLALVLAAAGLVLADDKAKEGDKKEQKEKIVETKSGLKYVDVKEGSGPAAKEGDTVVVHYTGWLKDGTKFHSSKNRLEPFELTIGKTRVIKGWTEGLQGMKAGGTRKLIIPSELAYGKQGRPPVIPANAELTFEVEMLEIK